MFEIEDSSQSPTPDKPRKKRVPVSNIPPNFNYPKSDWRHSLATISTYLCCIFAILAGVAWWQRDTLPHSNEINETLYSDPVQEELDVEPFPFQYGGATYGIEPVASYEISGVIVEHNNPQGWGDIYHDENSVDFRDLCIVWGDNLKDDVYRDISYWHETWTCWWKSKSNEAMQKFSGAQLSNNHLLSANDAARNTILRARIGDQIYIRGMLVNYWLESNPSFARKTSIERTDSGDGACEVIFVESAEIIKSANDGWRLFYTTARNGFFLALAIKLALFLFLPLELYRKQR